MLIGMQMVKVGSGGFIWKQELHCEWTEALCATLAQEVYLHPSLVLRLGKRINLKMSN